MKRDKPITGPIVGKAISGRSFKEPWCYALVNDVLCTMPTNSPARAIADGRIALRELSS